MELRQIRYFLSVCEHGSFSRAAESCHVTQPAMSKAVKALEAEVGGELLHREGRRLVLSELGQMVRPHLERLAGEQDAAIEVARNFRLLRQAPLRVGVLPTIGPARIARFLGGFRRRHPGIEVAVSESAAGQLARSLEQAQIDVAIANGGVGFGDGFRVQSLYRERYVVVFAPGHRLATLDAVGLADLDGEDYVDRLSCELREMVMQVVRERQVQLYARFRSEREDWVQSMVLAGLGFAFMPEHSVTLSGLLSRPLADPPVARDICAIDLRGRARGAAAQALLRELAAGIEDR